MTSHDTILRFWQNDLIRVPGSLLTGIDLPADTKVLLQEVGLPTETQRLAGAPYELKFQFPAHTWPVIRVADENYVTVAHSVGSARLGIRESSGEVFYIDAGENDVSFINSSLELFLLFLATRHLIDEVLG